LGEKMILLFRNLGLSGKEVSDGCFI